MGHIKPPCSTLHQTSQFTFANLRQVHLCVLKCAHILILSFSHRIMAKFCGYLLGEDWLLQRALEMGVEPPKTRGEHLQAILLASRDARLVTRIYPYTRLRHIKTNKGKKPFWCIAFASDDPHEGLPTSAPSEENTRLYRIYCKRRARPAGIEVLEGHHQ